MCTYTLIRLPDGYRVAFNRDELTTRVAGEPPRVDRFGDRCGIMPIDPLSGGTWMGVNDAGVTLALLNVYTANPAAPARRGRRCSRGRIIPSLLACSSALAVQAAVAELPIAKYPPFTLLCCDRQWLRSWRWDGAARQAACYPVADGPYMWTSSGMGDHLVDPPRRDLFARALAAAPSPDAQDAFHAHHWDDRPEFSIRMRRHDAETVSYNVATVTGERIAFHYEDGPPGQDHPVYEVALPLSAAD